jgi:glucokinase
VKQVVGIDLGGTKVAAGVVSEDGHIHRVLREAVILNRGPSGLIEQLARIIRELQRSFPNIQGVGLASAGPLDPATGRLLDPTNLHGKNERWGEVPLSSLLAREVVLPVRLENDAAAAALAEGWKGAGVGVRNFVVMTLGTGLGVGVVANGNLLRSGRGLHPEVGHVYLRAGDISAPCGCGNYGCAEAFLSGVNFTRRVASQWLEPDLTGEQLVRRARAGDQRCEEALAEYADYFSQMITTLVVLFSPEKILISGGFSEATDLFLPMAFDKIRTQLSTRRIGIDLLPEIGLAKLGSETGLLGGAYVALFHESISGC